MDQCRKKLLQANIWKLYVLNALQGAIFFIPILVPFYRENGISLAQLFQLEAVFSIEIVLLEIPTGYLSDRWHRKNTICVALLFSTVGWFLYSIGTTFLVFLIGEIIMGIGASLLSGTLEAMTYDTLLEEDRTDHFRRISGNQFFATFGTESIASILGGLIAVTGLRTAAWATVASPLLGFCIALTLVEPHRHKMHEQQHLQILWKICMRTFRDPPLRSIIVINGLIGTLTLMLFWFTQPYQSLVGLPIALFGVSHALIVGSGAAASRLTHALSRRIDDRLFLMTIGTVVIMCYVGLGFLTSLWALLFFLIGRTAWGFLSPLTSDMVNKMTSSDVRATVLSIRAMGWRFLFAISSPLIGYLADVWSLQQAILLTGALGGLVLLIAFIAVQRVWEKIPDLDLIPGPSPPPFDCAQGL